ncbi:MAG: hypothetical protein OEU86_03470 [Gammaproteobacteria bacterium]|nr:hypothetical protein [Gammaproteobacteria bacterium]
MLVPEMTHDDEKLRRKIRRNAIMLALVSVTFFFAFMTITAFRG